MSPFVPDSDTAVRELELPKQIQEGGREVRVFTPKWGMINERRNQLHEVIRLSGINIIVDETDRPLIIKVASVASARLQVYFIDNDDYFMRRLMAVDEKGVEYDDNGERLVFFARGVLETVKKLRWIPDVIHCTGWISALAPLYIKKAYRDEPSFMNVKVVYSVSAPTLTKEFGKHALECIPFKEATMKCIEDICTEKYGYNELMKIASRFSDGIILGDENVDPSVVEFAEKQGVPILGYQGAEFKQPYGEFYEKILGED